MICSYEMLASAMDLRKPRFAFIEAPEIVALVQDPLLNVLSIPVDEQRGNGLPGLLEYGVTEQSLQVLLDLQQISMIIEAYTQGTLQNPDVLALTSRRNEIHHALLSLPISEELQGLAKTQKYHYELCRLTAMIYDLSIIFPMPSFTGVVQRLVSQTKEVVEWITVQSCVGARVNFHVWVLFMSGTAAEWMPERPWFVQRLKALFVLENISVWSDLQKILNSFLWMGSAMDEPAINLWNEILDVE